MVGKVVLELVRIGAQGLEHYVGGTIAELSARDVAVLYRNDSAIGVLGLKVMDNDLAVASKLGGNALCKAREKLDLGLLHDSSIPFWRARSVEPRAFSAHGRGLHGALIYMGGEANS